MPDDPAPRPEPDENPYRAEQGEAEQTPSKWSLRLSVLVWLLGNSAGR